MIVILILIRAKMEVDDTLDTCEFEVIGEDLEKVCFWGWEQESVPTMCRPLQSP